MKRAEKACQSGHESLRQPGAEERKRARKRRRILRRDGRGLFIVSVCSS
jgi:hypothetical protein